VLESQGIIRDPYHGLQALGVAAVTLAVLGLAGAVLQNLRIERRIASQGHARVERGTEPCDGTARGGKYVQTVHCLDGFSQVRGQAFTVGPGIMKGRPVSCSRAPHQVVLMLV
jgi:hypothetical protein